MGNPQARQNSKDSEAIRYLFELREEEGLDTKRRKIISKKVKDVWQTKVAL